MWNCISNKNHENKLSYSTTKGSNFSQDVHPSFAGVLSEEQIRLKKMKKQHEDETARTSTVVTPTPLQEAAALDPQQQEMIEKLVAMQKQCNKRSFLDRPKVTVSDSQRIDFSCF